MTFTSLYNTIKLLQGLCDCFLSLEVLRVSTVGIAHSYYLGWAIIQYGKNCPDMENGQNLGKNYFWKLWRMENPGVQEGLGNFKCVTGRIQEGLGEMENIEGIGKEMENIERDGERWGY